MNLAARVWPDLALDGTGTVILLGSLALILLAIVRLLRGR